MIKPNIEELNAILESDDEYVIQQKDDSGSLHAVKKLKIHSLEALSEPDIVSVQVTVEATYAGFACFEIIEVLPLLTGKLYDNTANFYIDQVLRPSSVRVSTGEVKSNVSRWRVTVFVDDKNFITRIEQECVVMKEIK